MPKRLAGDAIEHLHRGLARLEASGSGRLPRTITWLPIDNATGLSVTVVSPPRADSRRRWSCITPASGLAVALARQDARRRPAPALGREAPGAHLDGAAARVGRQRGDQRGHVVAQPLGGIARRRRARRPGASCRRGQPRAAWWSLPSSPASRSRSASACSNALRSLAAMRRPTGAAAGSAPVRRRRPRRRWRCRSAAAPAIAAGASASAAVRRARRRQVWMAEHACVGGCVG